MGLGRPDAHDLPPKRLRRLPPEGALMGLGRPDAHDLRQRHKSQLGVAAGHKLVSLGDALGGHQLGRHRVGQALGLEHLHAGPAVGRDLGVGDGELLEFTGGQHCALVIDKPRSGAPQHQHADGVGEVAASHRQALLDQLLRGLVISGEQHLERRAGGDLAVELAGGAGDESQRVAGGGGKAFAQLGQRAGKVGGHRHQHGVSPCRAGQRQAGCGKQRDQGLGPGGGGLHRHSVG